MSARQIARLGLALLGTYLIVEALAQGVNSVTARPLLILEKDATVPELINSMIASTAIGLGCSRIRDASRRDPDLEEQILGALVVFRFSRPRCSFEDAGFGDLIDLRVGDARDTLQDCGGSVDLVLLDGFKDIELEVLQILQPQLRPGVLVFTDSIFALKADHTDRRRYVADPQNGFRAVVLPLEDGMEATVYTGAGTPTLGRTTGHGETLPG